MIKSQAIQYKDFESDWYKKWSILLRQESGLNKSQKYHNKAWQNAIILQALSERGYLKEGKKALGFGVGKERIPSALARLGVKVTATDQDFKNGKKGGWDNGQLTRSKNDLNGHGISSKQEFDNNVEFENCDMTSINKKFIAKYDIIWSNCALGHLGTIEAGLKFIEKSLDCLNPGGVAVHTTETNIVSNTDTIEAGGTVIFRRSDLVELFYRLRALGFKCAPLSLDFGSSPEDQQISFHPYNKDPIIKLNAGGYLLSQMVIIIYKPGTMRERKLLRTRKMAEEIINAKKMNKFIKNNTELQQYITPQKPITSEGITPLKRIKKLKIEAGKLGTVRLYFRNSSDTSFYDIEKIFHGGNPLMVATDNPNNRDSSMATDTWMTPSRPNPKFIQSSSVSEWGGIAPGSSFYCDINFRAPKIRGTYTEDFCFTLEGLPVIPGSGFSVKIIVS